ncbi:P-loop containing nucleoside triphosphate hydrolase [Lasallia pustulata]|uniref:p-loop containing nucleoside triphosphate hydrolase n=1 Tax=Lasallia pustulata TaxID=136370 RepID=A0A1W5CYB9_9LECA|nr:P-loop containing nucleoside triphosphate hydrolase [Lasallia pustulata]
MALNVSSADAWTRARDRYIEDLSDGEKQLFLNASLETVFYSASAAKKLHQSNVGSQLQTFAAAIEQYGSALDVYANSSSLILCPLWGSLASEFGKYFDKVVGMFERIGDVLPQFRIYERLFSNHERLVQALSVVYVDILKFCTDAKAVFRKGRRSTVVNLNVAMKLLWKPFDQQFGKTIEDFRKHLKIVDREAGLSHMVEAQDARAVERFNRMQIEKERKEDERLRLLSTLSSTRPEKKHHRLQRLRHPQTGTWFTDSDEFRTWKSSPTSSCLRCDGIPGSGKTILASHVIDTLLGEIDPDDSAISYFYCEYSDSRTLETFNVFGSILKQLLSRKPMLPEQVATTIKQIYAEGMSMPSRDDLVKLLRSVLGLYSRTYIVIDGLDECGKDAQEDILFIVKTLASFDRAIVKVVVFSRENAYLSTVLKHYPCLHTSEAALTRDIVSFVKKTVESKLEAGELVIRNPTLKEEIISELVTKA